MVSYFNFPSTRNCGVCLGPVEDSVAHTIGKVTKSEGKLHPACRACVNTWIKTLEDSNRKPHCPTCREPIRPTRPEPIRAKPLIPLRKRVWEELKNISADGVYGAATSFAGPLASVVTTYGLMKIGELSATAGVWGVLAASSIAGASGMVFSAGLMQAALGEGALGQISPIAALAVMPTAILAITQPAKAEMGIATSAGGIIGVMCLITQLLQKDSTDIREKTAAAIGMGLIMGGIGEGLSYMAPTAAAKAGSAVASFVGAGIVAGFGALLGCRSGLETRAITATATAGTLLGPAAGAVTATVLGFLKRRGISLG